MSGARARVLVTAAVTALLLLPQRPSPLTLGPATSGDRALADRVTALVGEGRGLDRLAVATVVDGRVTTAGFGDVDGRPVDADTPFAVGSVTKAMTGMLLEVLEADGVVSGQDTVGDLVPSSPLADTAAGAVTLDALATHRSGYPRLAPDLDPRVLFDVLTGGNPYSGGPSQVLLDAADVDPVDDPTFDYSNLGMAVLGDALAAVGDRPGGFGGLLGERLAAPLGLAATRVVASPRDIPVGAPAPTTAGGRTVAPWVAEGWQPAGIGVWSTAGDMARLVSSVADGSAPGADAASPRVSAGGDDVRIGRGWFTSTLDQGEVTWHDGGTGGFRSWVGFDRATGNAAVVLAATTRSVDDLGIALATGTDTDVDRQGVDPYGIGAVLLPLIMGGAWLFAMRRRTEDRADRGAVLRGGLETGLSVLLAARLGPWVSLGVLPWYAGLAVAVAGAGIAAWRWADSPPPSRRGRVGTAAHLVVVLTVAALLV